MKYFVLGVGYTGKEIFKLLVNTGDEVAGTHTKESTSLHGSPISSYRLGEDSLDRVHSELGWDGEDYHLIFTAGPPRQDSIDESIQLLENFVNNLSLDRVRTFSFISSTSVYGDANGDWVTEDDPLDPISRSGKLKVRAETMLEEKLNGHCPLIITRPGGIYGPERNGFRRYLDDYELVDGGKKWTNRIHVHDLARSILFLCEREESEVVNVVDGNPVRLGELVKFVYREAGEDPDSIPDITWEEAEEKYSEMKLGLLKPSKRVSSEKLKGMGFEFRYPTVFDGLKELKPE